MSSIVHNWLLALNALVLISYGTVPYGTSSTGTTVATTHYVQSSASSRANLYAAPHHSTAHTVQ